MPTRITLSLVILTPSVGLVWLRVMGPRIPPLFTLLTTLARDLRWSIVDIKPDPLVASVVNLCGIILVSVPVVKTGEPVTPDRIPRTFRPKTTGIPDPTGVDFCPKKGYDKNPWEYHPKIKIGAILYIDWKQIVPCKCKQISLQIWRSKLLACSPAKRKWRVQRVEWLKRLLLVCLRWNSLVNHAMTIRHLFIKKAPEVTQSNPPGYM